MISDQVPKLIGDQFDQPSNVHGKTGPKENVTLEYTPQKVQLQNSLRINKLTHGKFQILNVSVV